MILFASLKSGTEESVNNFGVHNQNPADIWICNSYMCDI